MSSLRLATPTRRTLRTDAVAYVDPQFPAGQLWSPLRAPVHTVERGEDVELNGELVLVDREPLFTGQQLQGSYETYWFSGDEITGLSLLTAGAEPVGALGGGYVDADRGSVAVTTREGLGLLPADGPPAGRASLRGGTTALVSVPVDDATLVPVDVLVDARHRPCGFIINGDLDLSTWECRILPDETGRVGAPDLLAALHSAPADHRPQVVTRTKGFLGREKSQVLGGVGDLYFERAWEFPVVPAPQSLTVGELITLLDDPDYRIGPDLGVEALSDGDPRWLTTVERDGAALRLVIADVHLPDKVL